MLLFADEVSCHAFDFRCLISANKLNVETTDKVGIVLLSILKIIFTNFVIIYVDFLLILFLAELECQHFITVVGDFRS